MPHSSALQFRPIIAGGTLSNELLPREAHGDRPSVAGGVGHRDAELIPAVEWATGSEVRVLCQENREMAVAIDRASQADWRRQVVVQRRNVECSEVGIPQ